MLDEIKFCVLYNSLTNSKINIANYDIDTDTSIAAVNYIFEIYCYISKNVDVYQHAAHYVNKCHLLMKLGIENIWVIPKHYDVLLYTEARRFVDGW